MAFTAGSVELAHAQNLANMLSSLHVVFGATGMEGRTAALIVETQARKMGFGITGITTGAGFPPFGSILPSYLTGTEAALQNPRGETMASGITLGVIEGRTVGIFLNKFVRSGADYRTTKQTGVSLAAALSVGDSGVTAWGGFTASFQDRLVFDAGQFLIVGLAGGATTAGKSAGIAVGTSTFSAPVGTYFNIDVVGITRGTSGIAGSTFESFQGRGIVNGGFTASVYWNTTPAGVTGWSVS